MLNTEYIHAKINAPETCFTEDSGKMKKLVELFPYASSFSILYLKSLANSGDIRLESELEKLAFKINARDILYNLIHSKPIPQGQESEELKQSEIVEEKQVEILEETLIQEKNKEEEIEQIEILAPNIESKSNSFDDELDKLIVSSALSTSFVERELEPMTELNREEKVDSEEDEKEEVTIIEEPVEKKLFYQIEETVEDNSVKEISSPKSFTAWLKVVSSSDDDVVEEQEDPNNTAYYTFEKPKKEFYSPVKKAKESLDENKMPVSETLAKIFALQGNYSKAIYVYEQLILIFPEKKSFFATQIKNLKKKINS